jgi:O-antigen/teichoic acid export membrane protein
VVVIAFPSMSKQGSGRRMHLLSLGAVLAIGLVTVAGVAVLSRLAVSFVGGPAYSDLQDQLWLFAVLGTLLAMIQLMVYDVVARQHQQMVFVVWAALVGLACAAPLVGSLTFLITVVVGIDLLLFLVLLVVSLRRPVAAPPEPAEARVG